MLLVSACTPSNSFTLLLFFITINGVGVILMFQIGHYEIVFIFLNIFISLLSN